MNRVEPGQRFSVAAADWNALRDVRRRVEGAPQTLGGPTPGMLPGITSQVVYVRNTCTEEFGVDWGTIRRWECAAIIKPTIEPLSALPPEWGVQPGLWRAGDWGDRIVWDVASQGFAIPAIEEHLGRDLTYAEQRSWHGGVALESIRPGAVGRMVVSGWTQACIQLTQETPEWEPLYVRIAPANRLLQPEYGRGAHRVVWHEPYTATPPASQLVHAIVDLGRPAEPCRSGIITEYISSLTASPGSVEGYRVQRYAADGSFSDSAVHAAGLGEVVPAVNLWRYSSDLVDQCKAQFEALGSTTQTTLPLPVGTIVHNLEVTPMRCTFDGVPYQHIYSFCVPQAFTIT